MTRADMWVLLGTDMDRCSLAGFFLRTKIRTKTIYWLPGWDAAGWLAAGWLADARKHAFSMIEGGRRHLVPSQAGAKRTNSAVPSSGR